LLTCSIIIYKASADKNINPWIKKLGIDPKYAEKNFSEDSQREFNVDNEPKGYDIHARLGQYILERLIRPSRKKDFDATDQEILYKYIQVYIALSGGPVNWPRIIIKKDKRDRKFVTITPMHRMHSRWIEENSIYVEGNKHVSKELIAGAFMTVVLGEGRWGTPSKLPALLDNVSAEDISSSNAS